MWRAWGEDAVYRAATHDDELACDELADRIVAFVDIAPDNEELANLSEVAEQVIVLDHHVSARNRYFEDPAAVNRVEAAGHEIYFDMEHSGAVLSWNYFHGADTLPDLLRYVEDQDLWNWKLPRSQEVNAAIASYPRRFEVWSELAQRDCESFVREGEPILRANRREVERAIKSTTTLTVGASRVEGVNATANRSRLGHELAKRALFGMPWGCVYRMKGQRVHASLYSIGDLDVSVIAAAYGGGGHRNAAGFTIALDTWLKEFA